MFASTTVLAWVTGQIGRDAETGDFVTGGFEAEFHQAITNLENILAEVGSPWPTSSAPKCSL